jgi:hypothetical protein
MSRHVLIGRASQLHLNSMADLSQDEYKQHFLGYKPALRDTPAEPRAFTYESVADEAVPKEVDWRKKGAVTEVKNQEQVRIHAS